MRSGIPFFLFAAIVFFCLTGSPGTGIAQEIIKDRLAEQVVAGKLPVLAERLPTSPMIVQPFERTGRFGGTWHSTARWTGDHAMLNRIIGYEGLVRWAQDWAQFDVVPNLAQKVESSPDAKEFTFHLRPGTRWSDGTPFTADDIMFWYDGVFQDPVFGKAAATHIAPGGRSMRMEKIDNETIRITFNEPYGLFLQQLARPYGTELTSYPRHKLERFHPLWNKDADLEAKQAGFVDWRDRFKTIFGTIGNSAKPDRWKGNLPTLNPWVLNGSYGKINPLVANRNPFYWKVDPDGRQLPYIDKIEFTMMTSKDAKIRLAAQGKVDMMARHIEPEAANIAATQPGFSTFDLITDKMNEMVISFNLTHKNPFMRKVFRSKKFRIALSLAVNRPRLIAELWGGNAIPYQAAPRPSSTFYHEKLATQYLEFDLDKANILLDEAGFTRRAGDLLRIGPDGDPIHFTVLTDRVSMRTALDIIEEDWRALGIQIDIRETNSDEFYAIKRNNNHDAAVWQGEGGIASIVEPRYFLPISHESNYAIGWAHYFRSVEHEFAIKPPAAVQRQFDLYKRLSESSDKKIRTQLMTDILDIAANEFYAIGVAMPKAAGQGLRRNTIQNVPSRMHWAWSYPSPGPTNPEQYFFAPETELGALPTEPR